MTDAIEHDKYIEEMQAALDNRWGDEQRMIVEEGLRVLAMLLDKNRKYGSSATKPLRVFSKAPPVEQILVRMDDKLSRIKTADPWDDEDPFLDLVGYLILLMVAKRQAHIPSIEPARVAETLSVASRSRNGVCCLCEAPTNAEHAEVCPIGKAIETLRRS